MQMDWQKEQKKRWAIKMIITKPLWSLSALIALTCPDIVG